jgi:hypothetical protein
MGTLGILCIFLRYNIYFAYWAVRLEQRTHETALTIFYFAIFMQQMSLTTFSLLRAHNDKSPLYIVSSIGAGLMGCHLVFRIGKNMLKHRAPLLYSSLCSTDPQKHFKTKFVKSAVDVRGSFEERRSSVGDNGKHYASTPVNCNDFSM